MPSTPMRLSLLTVIPAQAGIHTALTEPGCARSPAERGPDASFTERPTEIGAESVSKIHTQEATAGACGADHDAKADRRIPNCIGRRILTAAARA